MLRHPDMLRKVAFCFTTNCHSGLQSLAWTLYLGPLNYVADLPLSLSLSFPVAGGEAGHRPNPFQVAPEASRVSSEGVSWPGVPPGVIVGRTLEHQMLDRLVGAVAVWADGRVLAPEGCLAADLCVSRAVKIDN